MMVFAVMIAFTAVAGARAPLTFYVGKSIPGAVDGSNNCQSPATPCLTLAFALSKADTTGDVVRVLPNPGGATDVYSELVTVGTSAASVSLVGAGRGTGGTEIMGNGSAATVTLDEASSISDVHVNTQDVGDAAGIQTSKLVATATVARVLDDHASAPIDGRMSISDSTLSGDAYGAFFEGPGNRMVHTTVIAPVHAVEVQNGDLQMLNDVVLRSGTHLNATGLDLTTPGGIDSSITARGVTVTGFDQGALVAGGGGGTGTLDATNTTLAQPGKTDLRIANAEANAQLTNSDYSPSRTTFDAGATSSQVTTVNPVDVPPGLTADGHLLAGSQLIDRGTTAGDLAGDPADTTDLAGDPRKQGAAPDIGAYESTPPLTPGQSPAPSTVVVVPAFSGFSVTHTVFVVGQKPTPIFASAHKRGTTIRFTLNEPATVTIAIQRRASGRRSHGRCVKPSRRLRRHRRCTRYVTVGGLHRSGVTGANVVPFSGRIGNRPLRPGRYWVQITGVDASGHTTTTRRLKITIARR